MELSPVGMCMDYRIWQRNNIVNNNGKGLSAQGSCIMESGCAT